MTDINKAAVFLFYGGIIIGCIFFAIGATIEIRKQIKDLKNRKP